MIPAAIDGNYSNRLLKAGWWHMSLFFCSLLEERPLTPISRPWYRRQVARWLRNRNVAKFVEGRKRRFLLAWESFCDDNG